MKFLSSERLSQHKYKTPEGYLICVDAILARTGKQTYKKSDVFADGDDTEIEVDRKAEEVFAPATLASFENKPVTVEHPDEDVNAGNYNEFAVGFVRDVHKGQANGQDVILGTLVITDADAIKEIEDGQHCELSCGYDCDIFDEQHPEQRNIRGNHVALCECGRAGIAKIVDSCDVNDDRIIESDRGYVIKKETSRFGHEYIRVYYNNKEIQEFDIDDYDDEHEAINNARMWVHGEKYMRGMKDAQYIRWDNKDVVIVKGPEEILEDADVVEYVEYNSKKYWLLKGKKTNKYYFVPQGTFYDAGNAQEELAQKEYHELKSQLKALQAEVDKNDNNPNYNKKDATSKLDALNAKIAKLKKDFGYALHDSKKYEVSYMQDSVEHIHVVRAQSLEEAINKVKGGK